jgi:6,7-dimethyl-8-ribityllumazine synthase
MSNDQDYLINREFWFNEFVNDELNDEFLSDELSVLIDEIMNDKCDDEIITYVLSQLKKKHVVDAFVCYDVLIFDNEHFEFIRHEA